MKTPAVIVFCTLLAVLPLVAREKSDVLVMNNGDRLTVEVKGLDAGVLYVGIEYIKGTSQVNWLKVDHIESKQLFLVKTADGRAYTGTLSTAETGDSRPMKIEVAEENRESTVIERGQVVQLYETSDSFWRRFNGSINSGMTYTKANESRQFNFSGDAEYPRERWSAGASFNSNLTANTGASTATRNNLTLAFRHNLRWENWFYTGLGGLLQSTEQDLDLQTTIGGGIGRYLRKTNHAIIALYGGLAYQNAKYTQTVTHQPSQDTAAAMVGGNADLFKFDKTALSIQGAVFPSLNQPGRVFGSLNATYYLKFWSNFTWNLSFFGNWDNQPPPTFSGSDYGTSTGLGWKFGNK